MKLDEAKKDPDMVNEIYKQVNDAFLSGGSKIEYVASIKFRGQQYNISGTQKGWESFFSDGYMGPIGKQMNNGMNVLNKQ